MRVLIVANFKLGYYSPFVTEQVDALKEQGVEIDYFPVVGKGIKGYLKLRKPLLAKIKDFKPDIIHAHYGLTCLLANLQREVPVVSTYHGSDINLLQIKVFSKIAMALSAYNIFVSQRNIDMVKLKRNFELVPCGVNIKNFVSVEKDKARELLGLKKDAKLVLFAGSFSNWVKNYPLAKESIEMLDGVELLELKGYTRAQVNLLMHAVDACLMTSFTEGSPQFIKEAMVCNRPIVTTDVGDVRWVMGYTEGCYISSYDADDCANKIKQALKFAYYKKKTFGKQRIIELELDNKKIATKILTIYRKVTPNF